jgi:dihydrofolate reductase
MGISLIAAVGKNREIGVDNKLLWYIREDFQWFKQKTAGKMIVMGRNTFNSIGGALPNRYNIVLSKSRFTFPDIKVLNSVADVLDYTFGAPEVMIIGGASIYEQFLPYADRLYLTELDKEFKQADTFFPYFNKDDYIDCFTKDGTEDVGFGYQFKVYKKKLT